MKLESFIVYRSIAVGLLVGTPFMLYGLLTDPCVLYLVLLFVCPWGSFRLFRKADRLEADYWSNWTP